MWIGSRNNLLKFTCSPVESENGLRRPFRLKMTLTSPGRISSVSSAYCTIGKSPRKLSLMGVSELHYAKLCSPLFEAGQQQEQKGEVIRGHLALPLSNN